MESCPTEAPFLDGGRLNLPAWSWGGGGRGGRGGVSEGWTLPWRCDTRGPWTVLSPQAESFQHVLGRWMWTLWHLLWTVFTPISYYFIIISRNRNQGGMFGKTRSSASLENMAQELYCSPDFFLGSLQCDINWGETNRASFPVCVCPSYNRANFVLCIRMQPSAIYKHSASY